MNAATVCKLKWTAPVFLSPIVYEYECSYEMKLTATVVCSPLVNEYEISFVLKWTVTTVHSPVIFYIADKIKVYQDEVLPPYAIA